jgi:predicted HicB family RNase H-like nuclease
VVDWRRFTPENFKYDFERDKLFEHQVTLLSQEAIDRRVVAQSENDSAWEAPPRVKRSKPASLSIPGDLAARAAFLARLQREADLNNWVERVLRDRVELEEFAFAEAKKNLTP